jgi:REP element-mobilizing transposase RayT
MARPIRVEFPGALYHVTARGNERRKTFRDDADRRQFLVTLEEAIRLHELRLHAFCLMPKHYHLVVETPLGNLSRAIGCIGWLQTTYTIRFNRRHRRSGHLFQGPLQSACGGRRPLLHGTVALYSPQPGASSRQTSADPRRASRRLEAVPVEQPPGLLGVRACPSNGFARSGSASLGESTATRSENTDVSFKTRSVPRLRDCQLRDGI